MQLYKQRRTQIHPDLETQILCEESQTSAHQGRSFSAKTIEIVK